MARSFPVTLTACFGHCDSQMTFVSQKGAVLQCEMKLGSWPKAGDCGTMEYDWGANFAVFHGPRGTTHLHYSGRAYSDSEL